MSTIEGEVPVGEVVVAEEEDGDSDADAGPASGAGRAGGKKKRRPRKKKPSSDVIAATAPVAAALSLGARLTIKASPALGRYGVAKENVAAGDVLLVERAFGYAITAEEGREDVFCALCLDLCPGGGIPCTTCGHAAHCSPLCADVNARCVLLLCHRPHCFPVSMS